MVDIFDQDIHHTDDILTELVRILNLEAFKTIMGHKGATYGDLALLPEKGLIPSLIPRIFVKPVINTLVFSGVGGDYDNTHSFRSVIVFSLAQSTNNVQTKVVFAKHTVNQLVKHFLLSELTLSNGKIGLILPDLTEYEPIEDDFVTASDSDLAAIAVNFTVLEVAIRRARSC